jgi:TonB-dependent starch-binding outer membrane protein SusC
VLDTRLLSWDVTLQHGVHRTKLVDLGGTDAVRTSTGGWVEGYPLGARFQNPLLGYTDANGDGIIASDEVQQGDTAVYVGESTPPRSQTLTTVIGLFDRRLRLSALLERRSGFTQINQLPFTQCDFSSCRDVVDPSTPLQDQAQARYESIVSATPEPGDFTRLREVTAAFDLPVGLARALRVRSATLAISVRNLALWTDFGGPDPESAVVGDTQGGFTTVSGGTANGIPQARTWALRLDLGF